MCLTVSTVEMIRLLSATWTALGLGPSEKNLRGASGLPRVRPKGFSVGMGSFAGVPQNEDANEFETHPDLLWVDVQSRHSLVPVVPLAILNADLYI